MISMFSLHDSSTLSVCARRMGFEACWWILFRCRLVLRETEFYVRGWSLGGPGRKKSEPNDCIRPRSGVKKRKRFWLPPKKDLLSVGWSFRISISTGEVKVQFQREK